METENETLLRFSIEEFSIEHKIRRREEEREKKEAKEDRARERRGVVVIGHWKLLDNILMLDLEMQLLYFKLFSLLGVL